MTDKKIILAELSSEKKASMKEAIKEFATTETHFEFPISDYPEDKFHYWFAVEFLFWVLKKKCVELTPELEEKIIKRLEDEEDNKTLTVGTLQTIRKVFQKLKELVENV